MDQRDTGRAARTRRWRIEARPADENAGGKRFRVSRSPWAAYLASVIVLAASACKNQSPRVDGGKPDARPVRVGWAGCARVRTGPLCELERDRTLTLWIAQSDWQRRPWAVATDKGPVAPRLETGIDGGTRLTIRVPAGAHVVQLRAQDEPPRWSLAVADETAPAADAGAGQEEIARLIALGRTGKYADALVGLTRFRETAAPADRGPADAAIGRMALGLGDVDRAEPAFRASIAAAKVEQRVSDVVRDGEALLWAYVVRQQRYADARRLLAETTPYAEQYPEGQVWLDGEAGLLAADTADVRTALDRYHAAQVGARRLGLSRLEQSAADEVARVLTHVGRADEAAAIQKALPPPADPCARATRALNLSDSLMALAAQRSSTAPGQNAEVTAALAAAQAATDACPDADRRLLALINAAAWAIEVGDDQRAASLVQRLRETPPPQDLLRSCWRADVIGRWLLHQGQPAAALATFEAELPAARGRGLLDETFRAQVGAGRALLALGRRRAAVSRLQTARHLLVEMLRGIPIGEGRGSFLGGHDVVVRTLVQALVDGGAAAQAMEVARWSRSVELAHAARVDRLANLSPVAHRRWDAALERYQHIRRDIEREAGEDWKLPRAALARSRTEREARAQQARTALDDAYRLLTEGTDETPDGRAERALASELAAPGSGELFLAFFPGVDGWFALAATARGATARAVPSDAFASTAAAARALAPFGDELSRARRLRLFPYGAADRVSWQAVPWNGRPLLASFEVEYGLDVGSRAVRSGASVGGHAGATALVVSNPTGDLPAAALEAQAVTGALEGWNVVRLDGLAATRDAMLAALPGARLLHYAGHARAGATGPLSSALVLNGEGRIELGDLLAAPAVPELVILSACEAAGVETRQPSLMGLAQAFVAAGAAAALAPTRPVGDADARAFTAAFYEALGRTLDPRPDTAPDQAVARMRTALRTAATALRSRGSGAVRREDEFTGGSWDSFRLLVP